MILYLDFDGVMHPRAPSGRYFSNLPRLEVVMRDYEFLDVVIASSWREDMALEELREHFSADLRHRVIGVTPVHDVDPFSEIHGSRLGEVLAYLRASWCPAWLLDSFG